MIKKTLMMLVMAVFISAPVLAGNTPEFDCVGDDSSNFFNDAIKDMVVNNVDNSYGVLINYDSDLTGLYALTLGAYGEVFENTAGPLSLDPCFSDVFTDKDYGSAMVDTWNEAVYHWRIILQMKPESDIDLNIRDCVMKHNQFDVWTGTEQTGRYRAAWGQLFFIESANPSVSVVALAGPWATNASMGVLIMDARKQPTLELVPMDGQLYTSKALWDEALVLVMPETGLINMSGQTMYNLKHGDQIDIVVTVPPNNTCDIRYGEDNIVIKYIGIVGTEVTATDILAMFP